MMMMIIIIIIMTPYTALMSVGLINRIVISENTIVPFCYQFKFITVCLLTTAIGKRNL